MDEINRTYIIEYYKPLKNIEPPINVIELRRGNGEIIAQAKRDGIIKPIYRMNVNGVKYEIIFKQFRKSGFTILKNGEIIFRAKRVKITEPLECKYKQLTFKIKRIRGRELRIIELKTGDIAAMLRACGFEKALFSFSPKLKEISIPLAVALFAIKQLDVII